MSYTECECKFVEASTILLPLGRRAYASVMDNLSEEQEWNWGNNNRSLISRDDFTEALRNIDDLFDDDLLPVTKDNIGLSIEEAIKAIVEKLEALSPMCYIDLEN